MKVEKDKNLEFNIERKKTVKKDVWDSRFKRTSSVDVEELFKTNKKAQVLSALTLSMIAKLTGNFFQSLLSIFSCVMYVASTYMNDNSVMMSTVEYVVAALFSVDYLWGFTISKDKREFLLNPMNLVDLITIFPVILNLFTVSSK
jgi:hypothetical protein